MKKGFMNYLMKTIKIIVAAIIMLSVTGYGGNGKASTTVDDYNWRPGPSPEWFVNWDKALAEARKTGKALFLLSTGSDWCGWCKRLRANVLDKPEFGAFAREKLVLVYLDSPSNPPLGREQKAHNRLVTSSLPFGGGVPHVLVVNANGEKLGSIGGGGLTLDAYLEKLRGILAAKGEKMLGSGAQRLFTEGYAAMAASRASEISQAQPESPDELPSAWMTDCGEAQKVARETGKQMFVFNLPKSLLRLKGFASNPDFLKYATNRYVLLNVDGFGEKEKKSFPWAYNSGWPNCRILDAEGNLVGVEESRSRMRTLGNSDYYGAKGGQMLELLKGFELEQTVMPGALPKSQANPTSSDLSRLHSALSALPETYVNWKYLKWAERLVAADPDGLRGYRACYPYAAQVYPRIKGFIDLRSRFYSELYRTVNRRIKDAGGESGGRNWSRNVDAVTGEMAEEWEPKIAEAVRQLDQMSAEVPDGDSRFQFDNFRRSIGEMLKRQRKARDSRKASMQQKRAGKEKKKVPDTDARLSILEPPLSAEKAVACAKRGEARGFFQLAILYAKKASEYDSSDADRAKSLATSDKCLAKAVDMGYGNALFLRAIDIAHQNLFRTKCCGRHRHANDWYSCAGMVRCGMENTDLDQSTMLIDAFTNRAVVAEVVAAFDQAAKAGATNAVFFASYITNDLASSAAFKLRKRAEEAHESARIDAEVDGLLNGRAEAESAVVGHPRRTSAKETGWATSLSKQKEQSNGRAHIAQLESQFPFDEAVRMASKGNGSGFYSLALHYAAGLEVAQDGKRAVKYLEKAIDAKNGNAALVKALMMEDHLKGIEEGANHQKVRLLNLNRRVSNTADESPHLRIRKYTGYGFLVFTFTLPSRYSEGLYVTNDTAVAIVRSAFKKAVDLGCPSAKEEEERFERHVKRMCEEIRAEEAEKQAWMDKVNANAQLAQKLLGELPEKNPVYNKIRHAPKRDRGGAGDVSGTERRNQHEALLQIQEELRKSRLEKE